MGGNTAIEKAASSAGFALHLPFSPGRTDTTQELTDISSFAVLEPLSCGFRNCINPKTLGSLPEQLVEQSYLLTLTATEMTALVGGMRVLGANFGGSKLGSLTQSFEMLNNDFFVNLLDINTVWKASKEEDHIFEGRDAVTKDLKWKATSFDLIFGSNSQLRAIAEVFATNDSGQAFVDLFGKAWVKVMNLDRFDLGDSDA